MLGIFVNKKLSCHTETARRLVSLNISRAWLHVKPLLLSS